MCLSIVGCRKKAKEDIPVWKVLKVRKINDNLTQYRSPHYDHELWEIGATKTITKRASLIYKNDVRGGYLHSYKHDWDAQDECYLPEWYVFEAVIPKGTWYYEGYASNGKHSYASKSLRIGKITQYHGKDFDQIYDKRKVIL